MTTENNKIIAEFMGVKQDLESGNYMLPHYSGKYVVNPLTQGRNYDEWADRYTDENYNTGYLLPLEYLQYNTSFDWLMEVVEKIENLTDKNNFVLYDINIYPDGVIVLDQEEHEKVSITRGDGFTSKIEMVYNACVEFIKWYNEQKKV